MARDRRRQRSPALQAQPARRLRCCA